MKKLKILVSAYACSPFRGSEPGMGWNFVYGLSKFHEVHIIVEQRKWEKELQSFMAKNPKKFKNLNFYFIDKKRNKLLRKIWPPSYYWYYKVWQKKAYKLALDLDNKENFDVIHQLNMVGFREPGYLWKMDKPFVWGPIGGLDNSPWAFLHKLGVKGFIHYAGRNIVNIVQRNLLYRPKKAAGHSNSRIIAATPGIANLIKKLWKRKSVIICEVGQELNVSNTPTLKLPDEPLKIMWSGIHTSGKNLPLLMEAVKDLSFDYEFHVLGAGNMTEKWKKNARGLNIRAIWHGWIAREEAMHVMKSGHVLCITSIKDLTSTVTMEAISFGLPIICLDHCGFSHVVTDKCGIKIPVNSYSMAVTNFTKALEKLNSDEFVRRALSDGALERAKVFSWDKKIQLLNNIYIDLLKSKVA